MSGQAVEMMRDIGARARAAAQDLAYANPERKYAALIGASDAVWARRAETVSYTHLDVYKRQPYHRA